MKEQKNTPPERKLLPGYEKGMTAKLAQKFADSIVAVKTPPNLRIRRAALRMAIAILEAEEGY
ncbi:MAG TPA: hypothetical protein VGM23_11075 [Armatimonadota bacterium]|jgi:hypothetical protein